MKVFENTMNNLLIKMVYDFSCGFDKYEVLSFVDMCIALWKPHINVVSSQFVLMNTRSYLHNV